MNYCKKKCKGCGKYLSNDLNDLAYTPKDINCVSYCQRCFKLINYNQLDNSKLNEKDIDDVLLSMDVNDNFIFMIFDLFDLENSIIERFNNYENKIILINKIGCLPTQFNVSLTTEKIKIILEKFNVSYKKIILYDAVKKINISVINEEIKRISSLRKKIYFLGKTNVGKSTLINSLLKFNDLKEKLTVSPFFNTTLDFIKIKIDKFTIIDTPGEKNEFNFLNCLSLKEIKTLNSSEKFINKNFYKTILNNSFSIFNFFKINLLETYLDPKICFYLNEKVLLQRKKIKNDEKNTKDNFIMEKFSLNPNQKYNIFVAGASLISLYNVKEIELIYSDKIKIFLTDNAII